MISRAQYQAYCESVPDEERFAPKKDHFDMNEGVLLEELGESTSTTHHQSKSETVLEEVQRIFEEDSKNYLCPHENFFSADYDGDQFADFARKMYRNTFETTDTEFHTAQHRFAPDRTGDLYSEINKPSIPEGDGLSDPEFYKEYYCKDDDLVTVKHNSDDRDFESFLNDSDDWTWSDCPSTGTLEEHSWLSCATMGEHVKCCIPSRAKANGDDRDKNDFSVRQRPDTDFSKPDRSHGRDSQAKVLAYLDSLPPLPSDPDTPPPSVWGLCMA